MGKPVALVVVLIATGVAVALGVVGSGIMTKTDTPPAGARVKKQKVPRPVAAAQTLPPQTQEPEWEPSRYLCRLIIAEQQESREYYRRLAEGQITKFEIGRVRSTGKHVHISLRAYFVGLGYQDFTADNAVWKGEHFLTSTTQGSPLASVADIGPDEEELGRQIMILQHEHQGILRDLAGRKISAVRITSVDRRLDRSILSIEIVYRDGRNISGTIEMRYVNGYWYVVNVAGSDPDM